jgi:hypothetical protein
MRVDGEHDNARDAARQGFEGAEIGVLFESLRGRNAVLVLETGGADHSYPYGVFCQRGESGWIAVGSANSPAWYSTDDGFGVFLFWAEAPAGAAHVEWGGRAYEAEVRGDYVLSALWGVTDPADQPGSAWPRIIGGQAQ